MPGLPVVGRAARLALAAAVLFAAPALGAPAPVAPLLDGLRPYHPPAGTGSALAQRYFEQGMTLAWGFNPAEAARSFAAATRADPKCAACWWALAWAQGPNINSDMDAGAAAGVAAALARAQALAPAASARQRGLIAALAARHPDRATVDEEAYAARMRALARAFPRDAEILVLAAEAELNLHPYDWWNADGTGRPWTEATTDLLARALVLAPDHPGANHYWIHVMESSSQPGRATASADRLRTLAPGSGHLLHMPAHVYMRTGRYADASRANEASIAADRAYVAQVDAQRAYRVGYVAHNHHFLYASAAMEGRSRVAIAAADAAFPAACGPNPPDRSTGILQQYSVLPLFARVRFGQWRALLEDTLPPGGPEPYPRAIWHYARGTAYARTGRLPEARRELAQLDAAAADPALQQVKVKNINAAAALVRIAQLTLRADIAAAEGRGSEAVSLLAQAVAVEDALAYDEPHLWLAPTRHALGAALLAIGRHDDAARVYREDLAHYPDNGWSLSGLAAALRGAGRADAAAQVDAQARAAWRHADVPLAGSRM
ncbi:MAG: tetratricopeptide repeat protein [Burkholderiales bacterium]